MADFTLTKGYDNFPVVGQSSAADDLIFALGGNDSVVAGDGNDSGDGGLGMDMLCGGAVDDFLTGGELVDGGLGDDVIDTAEGAVVFAKAGNDRIMMSGDINATIWAGVGDHMVRVDVLKGATTGLTIAHGQDGIDRLDIGIYHQPEGVIGDISLGLVEGVWRVKVDGERHTVANGFARLSRFSASTMLTLQSGLGDDFIAFQAMDSTIAAGGGGDVVAIDPLQAGAAYAIDGGDGADRLVMYLDTAGAGATLDARRASPTLTVGGASFGASVSSKAIPVWAQVLATGCFRAPGMTM